MAEVKKQGSWLMRWYQYRQTLSPGRRLLITFLANCLWWLPASLIFNWFYSEHKTWQRIAFGTFFQASVFTLLFSSGDLFLLFKKKPKTTDPL